jgi:hypothetical protein
MPVRGPPHIPSLPLFFFFGLDRTLIRYPLLKYVVFRFFRGGWLKYVMGWTDVGPGATPWLLDEWEGAGWHGAVTDAPVVRRMYVVIRG